jgi:hypothetical protein
MSLTIGSTAAAALPAVNFHPHGHRRGAHMDAASASSSSEGSGIGQLPVGATTPLFSNLLQSLQQTVGAQAAASASAPVGALPASASTGAAGATNAASGAGANVPIAGRKQEIQAFLHSLFQALKQNGLSAGAAGAPVAAASAPVSASTTASASAQASASTTAAGLAATSVSSQYQGSLASALNTLIHSLSSGGAANSATANLNATFKNLTNATNGGTAIAVPAAGSASNQSSNAGLQSFLNNLLQNLQSGGVHSVSSVGNNVNASI